MASSSPNSSPINSKKDDEKPASTPPSPKQRPSTILGQKISIHRRSVYELLKSTADELRFYYSCIETRSVFERRFCQAATKIWDGVTRLEPIADHVSNIAFQYDFDAKTPGNGLRSIVAIIDSCVLHLLRILKDIHEQRSALLFRPNYFAKELEAYVHAFVVLVTAIERVYQYLPLWPADELFASDGLEQRLHVLMAEIESLDQSPFFGRAMGFQFCASMANVFQVIGISLASYSLLWDVKRPSSTTLTGAASNLLTSGQYVINPEERARRIFDVTINADIDFCKAFWNLTEGPLLQELPRWFSPTMAVNEMWQIPGDLALQLETVDGRILEVPPPSSHTGIRNLPVRVMSYHFREGMPNQNASRIFKSSSVDSTILPKSPALVLHVHGGGFVATSTKTHEPYLRHWAKSLNCPIVSVDYSLAPENPYPRAAEEVYYAFAWILANAERLGWTGERICFAGDSAGGLLLASTTLRLIKRNIRRLPDGLVLIYPAFLAQYSPSPSRLLSLLDPLLPLGIVSRCLAAYTGNLDYLKTDTPTTTTFQNVSTPSSQPGSEPVPFSTKPGQLSNVVERLSREPQSIDACETTEPSSVVIGTELGMDAGASVDNEANNGSLVPSFDLHSSDEEEEDDDGVPTFPISAKQAADVRQLIHKQLTRLSSPGRHRSHSDNALLGPSGASEKSNMESYSSSDETSEPLSPAIVVFPKDPKLMVFSAANCDESFLDYLKSNEATAASFQRFTIPSRCVKDRDVTINGLDSPSAPEKGKPESSPSHSPRGVAQGRSQSTGSLATITRVSASIGQKMGLYVMDNLSGWFSPGNAFSNDLHEHEAGTHPTPQRPPIISPLAKFHDMPVPKDPFLSPLLAPEAWLARFPRTVILACHLDPLLDDAVTFAKRLKQAGADVSLDLIDSLPHGFLNFAMFNPECREAARLCSARLREILKLNRDRS